MSLRSSLYRRHRFPAEIISHYVWLYFRFNLSYRDWKGIVNLRRNKNREIKATDAILDGEIVAIDRDGLPRFDGLRSRRDPDCSTVFYCFDLLYLDGYDLRNCLLIKRKALLKSILPKNNTRRIRFTDHVSSADGERLFNKLGRVLSD